MTIAHVYRITLKNYTMKYYKDKITHIDTNEKSCEIHFNTESHGLTIAVLLYE